MLHAVFCRTAKITRMDSVVMEPRRGTPCINPCLENSYGIMGTEAAHDSKCAQNLKVLAVDHIWLEKLANSDFNKLRQIERKPRSKKVSICNGLELVDGLETTRFNA